MHTQLQITNPAIFSTKSRGDWGEGFSENSFSKQSLLFAKDPRFESLDAHRFWSHSSTFRISEGSNLNCYNFLFCFYDFNFPEIDYLITQGIFCAVLQISQRKFYNHILNERDKVENCQFVDGTYCIKNRRLKWGKNQL